jgi:NTE family protein
MFGWVKIRKPKRTAVLHTAPAPPATGSHPFSLETDPLPPHPLLALLPKETLDRLIADSAVAEYPKGTVIYREGEPCDAVFLILSGRCEVRRHAAGGDLVETVAGPGDMLGDRALLNGERHGHTAVIATHAVLFRLPAQELLGLFAKDLTAAGRFTQVVVKSPKVERAEALGRSGAVRRVVSILPLSSRVDADAVVARLGAALRRLSGRRVLIVRLDRSSEAFPVAEWSAREAANGAEFSFQRHLRSNDGGYDELPLNVGCEPREAASIAPLISHCARHYPFVLLHLRPELPVSATIESVVESDLAYVLLQPSTQNLYDFRLLLREICDRTNGACCHVKPILCAEESIAAPDFYATLRDLGHPVHSIARGFPLFIQPSSSDHRFDLHVNRLAREIARCRVGLALSSGGAKGLAHIGVIQVLEENGIEIDCIAGASMGAYIGAIWAYGLDGEMLEKTAREVEGRWGLLRLVDPALPPRRGFLRTQRTIARLRKSIGAAHFSELVRPLRIVATQLDTLERVVFSTGEVARAVQASIAIPGVCVPVTLDGETYIDGGIADPLPVDVLAEMGIERIMAVNVIPTPERIRYWLDAQRELNGREPQPSALNRFLHRHFNYAAQGNILDTMMRAINGAQTRVAEASAREADVVLRPLAGDAMWHDFTRPRKYIALGRSVAEAQLAELKALAQPIPYEPEKPVAITPPLAA